MCTGLFKLNFKLNRAAPAVRNCQLLSKKGWAGR